jgi:FlaA1/EpsC-like NDP-sugar epimerase
MIKFFLLKLSKNYLSKWIVLFLDVLLVIISFVFAYFVRFNASFDFDIVNLLIQLPIIIVLAVLSFVFTGSFKGIIRHTGIRDVFNVFLGGTLLASLSIFVVFVNRILEFHVEFTIPISIIIIHYFINIFVLTLSRFVLKSLYEIISSDVSKTTNVLIYGAGDSGILTYGALNKDTKSKYEVISFIDDDTNKINKRIDRIAIINLNKVTKSYIEKNQIDEIIISVQNISPNRLLEITDYFATFKLHVKIVPPLSSWIDGSLNSNQIRDVNIEDLLERNPIIIDNPILNRDVNGKIILITGAAGSIGSEITRQVSRYNIKQLILIDQAESPLYELQQELIRNGVVNLVTIVGDVRDYNRMNCIFDKYQPNKVFHAAAYKHVPLMEAFPYEAVKINVLGTKNIADLSLKYGVSRFVMVSTDKAVNPTNIMGATKRVAEMYISTLSNLKSSTLFTITRFGNVLGSNGSVIPLFKKQIEQGGPVTVTHTDITRYFMTIPEACSLVLEAGTMGEGGEIYIFDMGKSVKIFDLAKKMIRLSGFNYPNEIDIKISGLRPGEKLYEELLAKEENTIATYHEKIMIAKSMDHDFEGVQLKINEMSQTNYEDDICKLVCLIKEIVPEFKSNNSEFEKFDKLAIQC